jgi:PAS domain S-box-containing protein
MPTARLSAVLAAVAAAALIVLYTRSEVRGGKEYVAAIDGARRLRELDGQLDRVVLESQGGLTQHYDALTWTVREMELTQERLARAVAAADPTVVDRASRASARIGEKALLIEQFKTSNSVVRNSLAYVPLAALRANDAAGEQPEAARLRSEIAAVVASVLRCSVACPAEVAKELRAGVATLGAAPDHVPRPARESVTSLMRHAALLANAVPQREHAIRALIEADSRPYDELYLALRGRREAAIERANAYRFGMVVLSIALLVAIALLVLRLRRNGLDLEAALASLAAEKRVVDEKKEELAWLNQSLEVRVEERTRELSGSREQYRVLLETTQAVPWEMLPGALTLAYVGPQASLLLGFSTADLLSDGFLERALHPEDRDRTLAWLERLSADGADGELEARLVTAEGRAVWVRAFASVTRDADRRPVRRGIFLDVTARRALEADLRSAQKLESVGRLAGGVAHEINTPVQFVSDSVDFVASAFAALGTVFKALRRLMDATPEELPALVAEARAADEAADTEYLLENVPEAIESSVEGLSRIATIVKALKEFSHPDRTRKRAVDLNSNIRSTLTIAANEYRHVAELVADLGDLPPVECHAGEINQVLLNLIVNASHAIADVVRGTEKRGTIELRSWRDADSVFICVRDTGAGIPLDVRSKIFDPFFTTKDVGRGTGQGLAIARNIVVDKHGGELTFDSEPGRGTAFLMRLPVTQAAALDAAA